MRSSKVKVVGGGVMYVPMPTVKCEVFKARYNCTDSYAGRILIYGTPILPGTLGMIVCRNASALTFATINDQTAVTLLYMKMEY